MFRQKKHLGQHFLKNAAALADIVRAAEISPRDTILEVGPGLGVLTLALAQKAKHVIAIEKDADLIPILEEKFREQKNVVIRHGDILKFTNYKSRRQRVGTPTLRRGYKLVANIPYYITSKFLRMFLSEAQAKPKLMVLMVQREIADRIIARDKKESLLSLSVKAYAMPSLIRIVPKGSFSPPPKVDSAVIKLDVISDKWFVKNHIDEKQFFTILKKAFQQKRKMLRRSLGIRDPQYANKRPEELSLDDWAVICSSQRT